MFKENDVALIKVHKNIDNRYHGMQVRIIKEASSGGYVQIEYCNVITKRLELSSIEQEYLKKATKLHKVLF